MIKDKLRRRKCIDRLVRNMLFSAIAMAAKNSSRGVTAGAAAAFVPCSSRRFSLVYTESLLSRHPGGSSLRKILLNEISSRQVRCFSQTPNRKNLDEDKGSFEESRLIPPTLDSLMEEEGFGALNYEPDTYDLEDMQKQEQLEEEFMRGSQEDLYDQDSVQAYQMDPYDVEEIGNEIEIEKEYSSSNDKVASFTQGDERATPQKTYINCPFSEKDEAKSLGAKWDGKVKKWYIPDNVSPEHFSKWLKGADIPARGELPAKVKGDSIASTSGTTATKSSLDNLLEATSVDTQMTASSTKTTTKVEDNSKSANHGTDSRRNFGAKASYGTGVTSNLDMIDQQLESLATEIYDQNKGKKFNINSPSQVSVVLFGYAGESTNKDVLDGMAGRGNRMAELVLKYRLLKQQQKRERKREEAEKRGTVSNANVVLRQNATIDSDADPLVLVDASSYIFRAYYSMPPIHRSDGMPTGAVLGFCNMLNRLILNRMINGERPRLVLVFDAKGATFRHEMYGEYKANRPEAPMDLLPQFEMIRQAAGAYGVYQMEAPAYEADDVIATLCQRALNEGVDVNIMSGDKDLMQLVTDKDEIPSVHMVDPMRMSHITYDDVVEKFGVAPTVLGDLLALAGDRADNVPGVPGIGPKIAAELLNEFGSLEKLLENADKIKQKGRREKLMTFQEEARLSRRLVELERNIPKEKMNFPKDIDGVGDLRAEPFDGDRLLNYFEDMGLRDLKNRVGSQLKNVKATRRRNRSKSKPPKTSIPTPEDFADVPF